MRLGGFSDAHGLSVIILISTSDASLTGEETARS